jgi:hypothetical protein
MTRISRLIAVLCVAAAANAHAQTVAGRVIDSATRAPVVRANVSLIAGINAVASTRTDDSGRFQLTTPRAGSYAVRIQLIGYAPFNRTIQLDAGATVRPTYTIARIPVSLDTVVTSSQTSFFNVTAGRTKFAEHMKLNLGQMVSGLEIKASKLGLLEFLGTIPGLRYVAGFSSVMNVRAAMSAPPIIPGRTGYLRGTDGQCLYGRVDHWPVAYLLYTQGAEGIDELVDVEDIMGVEVFSFEEVPKEWRGDARPVEIVWRHSAGGGPKGYVLGNGMPMITPGMLMQMPSSGIPPDTLRVDILKDVNPPRCGFVQIWTRISW